MKNVLIIGESNWPNVFSDLNIFSEKEPAKVDLTCLENGELLYLKDFKWLKIDVVIWRNQFYSDFIAEHKLLDLISLSNVECINPPNTFIVYGHNAAMYRVMSDLKLPVVSRRFFYGKYAPYWINRDEDSVQVLKVGDYHSGYGKSIIRTRESFQDSIDMAVLLHDIVSLEPHIAYVRDVRCLLIGDRCRIYEKVPSIWKANVCPKSVNEIPISSVSEVIVSGTKLLASRIGAQVLGTDWILDDEGNWYILEGNLAPGFETQEEQTWQLDLI